MSAPSNSWTMCLPLVSPSYFTTVRGIEAERTEDVRAKNVKAAEMKRMMKLKDGKQGQKNLNVRRVCRLFVCYFDHHLS